MLDLSQEIRYSFSRSSGPGGQNVNKVNTRVELRFNVLQSDLLDADQKERILKKLSGRINKEGELILATGRSRSQIKNRDSVTKKFYDLIQNALKEEKKRIATGPSPSSKEKRLKKKKITSERKEARKKPEV